MLFLTFISFILGLERYRTKKVIIITRDHCPYSQAMRRLLETKRIPFLDINEDLVDADVKAITNQPKHTYPSVYIDGTFIGGFEDAEKYFQRSLYFSN